MQRALPGPVWGVGVSPSAKNRGVFGRGKVWVPLEEDWPQRKDV